MIYQQIININVIFLYILNEILFKKFKYSLETKMIKK